MKREYINLLKQIIQYGFDFSMLSNPVKGILESYYVNKQWKAVNLDEQITYLPCSQKVK